MYYVYILRTDRDTLYIGQTNNLEKRLAEHNGHSYRSAKYMNFVTSCEIVYSESWGTRSEALKREYQLKQLSRAEKDALIAKQTS